MATSDLAGRGPRFGAAVVDALLYIPSYVLIWMGSPNLGHEGTLGTAITDPSSIPLFSPAIGGSSALVNLGLFLLFLIWIIPVVWLVTRGQTIGKRILGIKVVRADTGQNGGFLSNILLRVVVFWGGLFLLFLGFGFLGDLLQAGYLSVALYWVVPLLVLVNPLLVFTAERRCLHDMVAGTQVVKA